MLRPLPIPRTNRPTILTFVFALILQGTFTGPVLADLNAKPADPLAELMAKSDPLQDEWPTEKLWIASKSQLSQLFQGLMRPEGDQIDWTTVASPDAKATQLRPSKLTTQSLTGGFHVTKTKTPSTYLVEPATLPVSDAFRELLALMRGPDRSLRIETKIVSVQPLSETDWTTEVRYEALSTGKAEIREQTAYFNFAWSSKDTPEKPLIHTINLLSFQEVVHDRYVFKDMTRDVIHNDWSEHLQFGGEYWYGRIDAVGEINFMGHNGIAIGDANGDGLDDVYVAMPTGLPNKLFLHNPDGTVTDRAEQAGVAWLDDTKGVLFADMDNDGDQDLLCAIGPTIVLCKNDGTGRFDRFVSMRAPTPASFYSLAVADFDLDGDLDIYACRYVHLRYG
ncbi:MAG: VCBS repeat-containing protein, partial [Planctomycetota bacterium]